MRQHPAIFAICTTFLLSGSAYAASQWVLQAVRLNASNLESFKDCSSRLWYDREHERLIGERTDVVVPHAAVLAIRDDHATILVSGVLHGIPVKKILVPMHPLDWRGQSDQNSLQLAANIEVVRAQLQSGWGVKFVRGTPDGPDSNPNELAYFLPDPKFNPSLSARRVKSPPTWLNCATRPAE